jgi:hypothetical protein
MPRLSLGLGIHNSRKIGGKSIIPRSGLSLWLKADAGLTTTPEQFISQIVLNDAGIPEVDGTYTRASGGTTGFSSSNGLSIEYNDIYDGSLRFEVFFEGDPMYSIDILYDEIVQISILDGVSPAPTASITLSPTGNALVTAWEDQSGNGNNAIAYNSPQLVQNQLNSKPVIHFNGSNYASFPISLSAETSRTIFIVGKYEDVGRGQEGFMALGNSGSFDLGYVFRAAETDGAYYYTPGQIAAPTFTSVGNYHIETISHLYEDDSVIGINGSFGNGVTISLSAIDEGLIATRNTNYTENGILDIAEIIIYNRALTTQERQQVEAYLGTKYAIY